MGNFVVMKPNKITLEQSLLHEMLDYQDGQFVWKNKKNHVGEIAGKIHQSGYSRIRLCGNLYPTHRIMWIYHYGSIDENMQIDHINGIKSDNRIENLRLATVQQNCFNRSRLKSKGYSWNKVLKKWDVRICIDGHNKYLGSFDVEQDARNIYLDNCKIYHKEFSL
jgi:hypothetical protein